MGRNQNPYHLNQVFLRAQFLAQFCSSSILMIYLMRSAPRYNCLLMIQPCTSQWKVRIMAQHFKATLIDILPVWETRWDMEFNPSDSKCQDVLMTGSKRPVKQDYILYGQVLESVTCSKYLGLTSPVPSPGIHTLIVFPVVQTLCGVILKLRICQRYVKQHILYFPFEATAGIYLGCVGPALGSQ